MKIYTDKKTWEDARAACKVDGADLVKIVDGGMNEFIWGEEMIASLQQFCKVVNIDIAMNL